MAGMARSRVDRVGLGFDSLCEPGFRVGVDEADLVIEEHGGIPRMKLAAGGILGDVDGNGQVDVFDVLYVLLYSKDSSVVLPTNGDISLGDVNGDGRVDIADAVLLLLYSSNPSDPTLSPGNRHSIRRRARRGGGGGWGDTPADQPQCQRLFSFLVSGWPVYRLHLPPRWQP